jgi:alkanesulfonate monooxygenase SsuD/methylene tetrahydromethanopterin reductase-like flavin-dependent oxidoreductase (luciferase family)
VIGIPYREPALLAKMAESLDRLSGGRLILGLGAGSGESEFRAMGLPESTVLGRVQALEEAIEIVRALWQQPTVTYEGERYVTRDAQVEPRPSRRIPIWLGTAGPRGLNLVGRLADGWIPSLPYAPPERAPLMIARILAAATEANRDPDDVARIYNLAISFEPDPDADVVGNSDQIAEQLIAFTRMGFTGFNFQPLGPDREGQVERLAREVIPAVREGL